MADEVWFPPSTTHPLPVQAFDSARSGTGDDVWYPPSPTHPLPVTIIGGTPMFPEPPDSQLYGRRGPSGSGQWSLISATAGPPEAPTDGAIYGRGRVAGAQAWTPVLPLTGGTMTGALTLAADPVSGLQAATRNYVDNKTYPQYLPLAGGTMNGALTLAADPVNPLQAATKQYIDNAVGVGGGPFLPLAGGVISGAPGSLVIGAPPGGSLGLGTLNLSGVVAVSHNAAAQQSDSFDPLLRLAGANNTTPEILLDGYGLGASAAAFNLRFRFARGTAAIPSAPQANDPLGTIGFLGYAATGYVANAAARIVAVAAENWTAVGNGSQLLFYTTAPGAVPSAGPPRLTLAQGLVVGNPTNGDQGAGSINAEHIYVQGVAVGAGGTTPPGGSANQAQYNVGGTSFGGSGGLILSATAVTALNVGLDAPGDIYFRSATGFARLGIGAAGQVLTVAAGLPSWAAAAGGGAPGGSTGQAQYYSTSTTFGGSSGLTLSAVAVTGMNMLLGADGTGDLYYRAAGGALTRLGIGSAGQVLEVTAGLPAWATIATGGGTVNSGTGPQIAQYPAGTSTVVAGVTMSGDATIAAGGALTINANAVTYGKMQAASVAARLIGSAAASTALGEITLGTNLSMTGSTLNATGSGTVSNAVSGQMAQYTGTNVVGGVTIAGDATIAAGGALTLANTAIVPGGTFAYPASLTIDAKGRITAATAGSAPVAPPVAANPTATIGGPAVNGVAPTFMRSDAAPLLGTVGIPYGGTGQTTAANALTALGAYPAANPSGFQTAAQVTAVVPVASSTPPVMDGTAAIGTGTTWARADHVHASDTSRAPLASPTFTGTITAAAANFSGAVAFTVGPTAPTPASADSSTTLATTAFVHNVATGSGTVSNAVAGQMAQYTGTNVVGGVTIAGDATIAAGGALTLANTAIAPGGTFAYPASLTIDAKGRITAATAGSAPVAPPMAANPTATIGGPAVNGVAPTFMRSDAAPLLGTVGIPYGGTGQTTAANALTALGAYPAANPSGFQTAAQVTAVVPVASSTPPVMDGTAAIGTGTTWARADHVHASDTSRAPLASPTFTGTPAAPTATPANTNTTQIATTAFVQSAIAAGGALPAAGPAGSVLASDGTVAAYTRDLTNLNSIIANQTGAALPAVNLPGGAVSQVVANSTVVTRSVIDAYGANLALVMRRAQGTPAGLLATALNNNLGQVQFYGHDGTAFATQPSAFVRADAADSFTTAAQGATLALGTVAAGGLALATRMLIGQLGGILIGAPSGGTGGDMGNGTINVAGTGTAGAPAYLLNGVPQGRIVQTVSWIAGANPNSGLIYRADAARTIVAATGAMTVPEGVSGSAVTIVKVLSGSTSGSPIHSGSGMPTNNGAFADFTFPLTVTSLAAGDKLYLVTSGSTWTTGAGGVQVTLQ